MCGVLPRVSFVCDLQLHEWAEMKLKKMQDNEAGISPDEFQVRSASGLVPCLQA